LKVITEPANPCSRLARLGNRRFIHPRERRHRFLFSARRRSPRQDQVEEHARLGGPREERRSSKAKTSPEIPAPTTTTGFITESDYQRRRLPAPLCEDVVDAPFLG